MITNYLYLNRELLDDVKGTLGSILVITKRRTDAVNFYNELLGSYKDTTGSVLCDTGNLTVSSKPNKIVVKAVEKTEDLDHLRGQIFTKVYAVGFYSDEEMDFLNTFLLRPRAE